MKKYYQTPECEIEKFLVNEIISTSDGLNDGFNDNDSDDGFDF